MHHWSRSLLCSLASSGVRGVCQAAAASKHTAGSMCTLTDAQDMHMHQVPGSLAPGQIHARSTDNSLTLPHSRELPVMGTTMRPLQPAFHTCRPLMLQMHTLVVPCWRSACFAQPGRPPWILSSCFRCAFTGCRRADGSVSSLGNQRRGGTGSAGSRGLLHTHTDSTPLQDANTEDHRRTDQSSDTHIASLPTHPPQPAYQAVTGSSGCYTHNGTHCPFALHGPESWAYGVGRAVLHASWQQLAGSSGVIRLGDTSSDRAAVLLTSPSALVCFLAVQMELAPNTGPGPASGHSHGSVAWPMLNHHHRWLLMHPCCPMELRTMATLHGRLWS